MRDMFPRLTRSGLTFRDARGHIQVLYETETVVLKRSFSAKGVFRGLHRQVAPAFQHKIIRVISGRIIDFVTDPSDPDGVIWYSEIGPSDDWVHIDANLAHGFYALEDVAFEYFCDGRYDESAEESYLVAECVQSALGLDDLQLSEKDRNGRVLNRAVKPAPFAKTE